MQKHLSGIKRYAWRTFRNFLDDHSGIRAVNVLLNRFRDNHRETEIHL